jgi:hypothetical protein
MTPMAVAPGKINFLCPQGSTFSKQITYKINDVPLDLTGYSSRLQVRQNYYSENPLIDLYSPDNGITINSASGAINVFIHASVTAEVPAGTFLYDLELESSGGEVNRILEGSFFVTPEVTR